MDFATIIGVLTVAAFLAGHAYEGAAGPLDNLEALHYQSLFGTEVKESPDFTPLALVDAFDMHELLLKIVGVKVGVGKGGGQGERRVI